MPMPQAANIATRQIVPQDRTNPSRASTPPGGAVAKGASAASVWRVPTVFGVRGCPGGFEGNGGALARAKRSNWSACERRISERIEAATIGSCSSQGHPHRRVVPSPRARAQRLGASRRFLVSGVARAGSSATEAHW